MFNFEKKVLSNGLRVILVPMENSEAVTIQVLVGVGSNNETKKINGISHFLEHLFFKGTKKRPNPGDINKELDRMGASHNAFTTKEATGFWVKSSIKDFDISFDIISDIILNSLFKKEEIEKEREVILQEINMYEDIPPQKILKKLISVMYGDQSMGWETLGEKESVKRIEREDIIKYRKVNYSVQNMIIVVAGNIDAEKVFKKISGIFSKNRRGKYQSQSGFKDFQDEPQIKIIDKKIDQSHLAIGIKAFDMFDERRYALNILSTLLGEKSSSRLFMEIREKLGLAYYVGSMSWLLSKTGILFIRAGVSHDNLKKTVEKIVEIIKDIKNNGIAKKELEDAKSHIRGQVALSFETTDQVADFYGEQELFYKKIMQPEEILKKIEKVSQSDILKVTRDIFRPEKISMAVIGHHEDVKNLENYYRKLLSNI